MVATLLLWSLVGCWERQESRLEVRQEAVSERMAGHFEEGAALRDAVVGGDLEAARKAADALSERLPVEALSAAAKPHEAELASALRQVRSATEPGAAAAGVARAARACGACHEAVGQPAPLSESEPPIDAPNVVDKMEVHRWAAERMWDGLTAPDDAAFAAGVGALATAALVPSGSSAGSPLPPLATDLAVQVQDKAAFASQATDPDVRARLYGELLATCADCHSILGGGPEPVAGKGGVGSAEVKPEPTAAP